MKDKALVRHGKTFELPNGEQFTFRFEPAPWYPCDEEDRREGISNRANRLFDKELHALTGMLRNIDGLCVGSGFTRFVLLWHNYRRLDAHLQDSVWRVEDGEDSIQRALESVRKFDDFAQERIDLEDYDDGGPLAELGRLLDGVFGEE